MFYVLCLNVLFFFNSQFTIHYSLITIHNSQFTIHNSQFTIHYSLFTIHFFLSTLNVSETRTVFARGLLLKLVVGTR